MSPLIDLSTIKWRLLPEILLLVTKGVIERTPELKQLIQDKYNEKKYGFVPHKEELGLLQQVRFDASFVQIKNLVPKYRYIDLIRTGLLIRYYHNEDTPGNRARVNYIKGKMIKRAEGRKFLKIANMSSTPYFNGIGYLLQKYKNEGYSEKFLEETIEIIVDNWEKNAMLVLSKTRLDQIYKFCESKMINKEVLFFLCGMKSASIKVESTERRIIKEGLLTKYRYSSDKISSVKGNTPRTQIIFQRDIINN